jgi:leucyl aminopeptidase
MKWTHILGLAAAAATTVGAMVLNEGEQAPLGDWSSLDSIPQEELVQGEDSLLEEQYGLNDECLLEFEGGETLWTTESQKFSYMNEGIKFIDITATRDLGIAASAVRAKSKVTFPSEMAHTDAVEKLLPSLNKTNMRDHLEEFTSFHTRYYKSEFGKQSSEWLLKHLNDTISEANGDALSIAPFEHTWAQSSIIATIPGRSNRTIVIGAHQDSVNQWWPTLAAPGADDDGSGTVTIWEALRVLLTDPAIVAGEAENTLEFHWYSAEEGGLLGSQAIFSAYQREGRDVAAMLQQDMTGYAQGTLDAGKPESVGIVTDYVDPDLTAFIKKVITAYCDIPYTETKCGYACSDHASASRAGYQSAFVIEAAFEDSSHKIHTTEDRVSYLSFDHMLQHAKLTLGLAYERLPTICIQTDHFPVVILSNGSTTPA